MDSSENAYSVKDCIQFPIKDAYEELIKEFVVRERGELMVMPHDDQKYTFHNHPSHQLSLVEINDNDEDDDDEDGVGFGQRTVLACDGCTVPISSSSSSSSSAGIDKYSKHYMSCGECKYSLHVACFNLPPELSSHPLHKDDHKLILESTDMLNFKRRCSICEFFSNGLFYDCTECNFKADIKCASLPKTIRHVVHPQHRLHSTLIPAAEIVRNVRRGYCGGCSSGIYGGMFYKCGSCDFTMCNECCLLPPVNRHEGDKHPLPLRYDAHLNHPDEFYCDECEEQMIPKVWMYHCHDCDTSFHPRCFPPTSGEFRNFKFGNKYGVDAHIHPHPLTFQILTTKLRCDWCNVRVYGIKDADQRGFHCSLCNFFMCLRCGLRDDWMFTTPRVHHLV